MTDQNNELATLAGWLEVKCGPAQSQYIIDEISKIQQREKPLECMEIMLLADLIHGYRKEMLCQIKEYKALRNQECAQELSTLHIWHELKDMKENICKGIACWTTLRDDYFLQRACYMEQCRRIQNGFAIEYTCHTPLLSKRYA